jgi:hypothetical protein
MGDQDIAAVVDEAFADRVAQEEQIGAYLKRRIVLESVARYERSAILDHDPGDEDAQRETPATVLWWYEMRGVRYEDVLTLRLSDMVFTHTVQV